MDKETTDYEIQLFSIIMGLIMSIVAFMVIIAINLI